MHVKEERVFSWKVSLLQISRKVLINQIDLFVFFCQCVTLGRGVEVPQMDVLVPKLAFRGNFIIVLKRISVRNLKSTLKLFKSVVCV